MAKMMSNVKRLALIVSGVFWAMILLLAGLENQIIVSSLSKQVAADIWSRNQERNDSVFPFPIPCNDVSYQQLAAQGADLSTYHMRKFLSRKSQVPFKFNATQRYQPVVSSYAAIPVSRDYAYLHVYKCGGTTIEEVTDVKQLALADPEIQSRRWFTLLRDPINRMLSAWAECGVRLYEHEINFKGGEKFSSLNWLEGEYDFRVRAFLREVKDYLPPTRSCHTHAFPQANFMLNATGHIDEHVQFVGDLSEMRENLQVAGLRLGSVDRIGRDATENLAKIHYFPSRRDLLSDDTILELCEFYAIDYYLFDFAPPTICTQKGGPLADIL